MQPDANVPHIAVGLIVAEDGRVLLQHRDDKPGIHEPGAWGLFGGHIEPDEDPAEAFLREMEEELGWKPKHFEDYETVDLVLPEARLISHVFAAHLDVLSELSQNEGQGMGLFAPDALPERIATDLPELFARFAATDCYRRVRKTWDVISVTAIIVDRRGWFLVQHRDDKPDIVNPGLWGSFGGLVEPHETPETGFLREMEEELSWRPKSWEMYGAAPYTPQSGPGSDRPNRQLIYVYAAPLGVPYRQLELREGQGMALFPLDGLPQTTVTAYLTLLRRFVTTDMYRAMMSASS